MELQLLHWGKNDVFMFLLIMLKGFDTFVSLIQKYLGHVFLKSTYLVIGFVQRYSGDQIL